METAEILVMSRRQKKDWQYFLDGVFLGFGIVMFLTAAVTIANLL